jgi:hypothetical protein
MADPELQAHREWLGYVQPVGVVVSPPALVKAQAYVSRNVAPLQQLLLDVVEQAPRGAALTDLPKFVVQVLRWDDGDLVDAPSDLECSLPEYGEVLRATYAVHGPEPDDPVSVWMMLVQVLPEGTDLDSPSAADDRGWRASPESKFERLLRESRIPIGLLTNGSHLRLVHAPRGETSGHLTFPVAAMTEVAGRPILAALDMLLCAERLFTLPREQRLQAILDDSRRYQNDVSTRLAGQVLAGLYELLRGFQAADDHAHGELLHGVLREEPDLVYEGLLTVLLRLVFLLYAEDRDLMPADDVYSLHYSVGGLFERLRADAGRYPDTMDLRYGAWAQLLSLFRIVFDGVRFGGLRLPPRQGHLFDPDRFPFLEGRPHGVPRVLGSRIDAPLVSDGVVWRVLNNLLVLDGERLSYRSLDVEQIGSVYETMMGFRLEIAGGHSLALKPPKQHGAPVTINVDELLATTASKRAQWVREQGEQKLTLIEATALVSASTIAEVELAIERKIDRRATPSVVPAGAMILQPNEERRRSGSFYTPRSLTEPIVSTTLRPIFEHLGDNLTPEAILDLKVCDPAMGSGAFLVEACRQLADRLVDAWHAHDCVPAIPPDSDELLHARRLVAHRCLYGVDRNAVAVDLAKLSLWLVTLARDHAFTFVDHALRCGDSLVGLTRDEIVAFHWLPSSEKDFITRSLLQSKLDDCEQLRAEIRNASDDSDVRTLRHLLKDADDALNDLRLAGDLVILAFFSGSSRMERQQQRDSLAQQVWAWQQGGDALPLQGLIDEMHAERHVIPFHWEIEFPEVFDHERGGFDAVVGNPPFLGGRRISTFLGAPYLRWLAEMYPPAGDLCDLVAYFFRRVFSLLRAGGCLGLLATNTISQGDTREGGLVPILESGGSLVHAVRRLPWPGYVSVVVSILHIQKGHVDVTPILDGRPCDRISAYLVPGNVDHSPTRLRTNPYYSSGSKIYGQGFLFDDSDPKANPISLMTSLLQHDPRLRDRILPYIGGDEINTSPILEGHRYVIYLSDLAEEDDLADWRELATIVREKVKPGRDILSDTPSARALTRRWWAYQAHRPELYSTAQQMSRVLVNSQVSTHLAFAFLGTNFIYSQKLVVILLETFGAFGVLQSRVHELWARRFSSTLGDALSYSPEDCFATFPFPHNFESDRSLDEIGERYYAHRGELMVRRNEGLTKTYGRFHDPNERSPEISRLRELHDDLDRTVLHAYEFDDLWRPCEFLLDFETDEAVETTERSKPWRYRWPDDVGEAILGRLLALNAERAQAERLELGDPADSSRPRRAARAAVASGARLFEEA